MGNDFWRVLAGSPQSPDCGDWGEPAGITALTVRVREAAGWCNGTLSLFTITYNLYIKKIFFNVATNSMLVGGVRLVGEVTDHT